MTNLEEALRKLNVKRKAALLGRLDVCHVTLGKYLQEILAHGELQPRRCDTFNQDLLYFSYGAPYYRPPNRQTEDALEFPVALLFENKLLEKMDRFYPFDTGALLNGIFGKKWANNFSPIEDFCVQKEPEQIIGCFYGNNRDYLRGKIRSKKLSKLSPVSLVHDFLVEDMSKLGVDQRQRTVECITGQNISILENLLWIAYPGFLAKKVASLWEKSKSKFKYYQYENDVNENPASLVTHLSKVVRDEFSYRFEKPTI